MSRIDYSVWDHIEVSDDEDDTHPNIDTPSLFRWRHQVQICVFTVTQHIVNDPVTVSLYVFPVVTNVLYCN